MGTNIDNRSKGRVLISLQGGLGNQLFQLCAGLQVSALTNKRVFFIENFYFKKRRLAIATLVQDSERSRFVSFVLYPLITLIKILHLPFVVNVNTDVDRHDLQSDFILLNGWFQSYNLVDDVHYSLIERLRKSTLFRPLVLTVRSNAIGVHLRYGDYEKSVKTRAFHGLTSPKYFDTAIEYLLKELTSVDKIIFVTDDLVRAKVTVSELETCRMSIPVEIICSTAINDMTTLSGCSGIVLSNSSFSWWAGYLGSSLRASSVVAPKPWLATKSDFDRSLAGPNWYFIERGILDMTGNN
jgi:hypothetical protein